MKRFLLPILIGVLGLPLGAGAGYLLRPAPQAGAEAAPEEAAPREYVDLSNEFVIPILSEGVVAGLVVLSLSLEVEQGQSATVLSHEPKLRDVLLQAMFAHANAGGFRGSFTDSAALAPLRQALFEAASGVLPDVISDVLINDIVRQDG